MKCHKCGSQNLKRYAFVCEEGTSTEKINATVKPSWNTKPFGTFGKQKVSGTRTVMTALAKRCSAPTDPSGGVFLLATVPALLIGLYLGIKIGVFVNMFWVGFLVFAFSVGGVVFACHQLWLRYLGGVVLVNNYQKELREWQHSWLCMQCGAATIVRPSNRDA